MAKGCKVNCKINKHLLPLKALLFLYNGAYACLLPYLTVHMRQIGISVEETAIIHSIIPISAFSGPPVAGYFADKFGGYKVILILSLVANALFHTALLGVPNVSTEILRPLDEIRFVPGKEPSLTIVQCPGADDCQFAINVSLRGDLKYFNCQNECPYSGPPEDAVENATYPVRLIASSACRRLDPSGCQYDVHRIELINETAIPLTPFLPYGTNSSCSQHIKCSIELEKNPLSNEKVCEIHHGNKSMTFWLYLILRVFASAFLSSCLSLLDATALVMTKEHDAEYGRQRLWSILATSMFPPLAGILVDYSSLLHGYNDYSPTFFTFDVLILCTVLLTCRLDLHIKWESDTNMKDFFRLLKKLEIFMMLVCILVLGSMWGFIETFLYWYLLDLGSPKYLLGLTLTVGSGISVPVMYTAEKIVNKIGHSNCLGAACIIYCLRYLGYSIIQNAWWALIFEVLEMFTINLMWVAAITYAASLAPESLLATMQGMICGIHYGIGRGIGSCVGGFLMQYYGPRYAYQCMGIGCAVFGLGYTMFSLTYLKRQRIHREREKEIQLARNAARRQSELHVMVNHHSEQEKQNND
ncbi:hypothetical protein CHUAL_002147 [Chamberlinius hualienensis]